MMKGALFGLTLAAMIGASPALACPRYVGKDLRDLFDPDVELVVAAHIHAVRMIPADLAHRSEIPALHLSFSRPLVGGSGHTRMVLPMGRWRDVETLQKRYSRRTGILLALKARRGVDKIDLDNPKTYQIAGKPCGGQLMFPGSSPQARAVQLIFDGEGDALAETLLFNKLFHYGREDPR